MTIKDITKIVQGFISGVVLLISLYVLLMRLTTGSFELAISQFEYYKFWILSLSVGFGIQLALYKTLKLKNLETANTLKVTKITGTTSTATMVACCAHHVIDVLPILGISALSSFLGAYTEELFFVGVVFNLFGIGYLSVQLGKMKNAKI